MYFGTLAGYLGKVTTVGSGLTKLSPGCLRLMSGSLLLIFLSTVDGVPVCQWGRYGPNCDKLCSHRCRLHPRRNLPPCDKDTGKCLEGCVRGRHGGHCDQLCSQNCINTTCNQPNGECTLGCIDGYTGYFCNMTTVSTVDGVAVCQWGRYGPNCDKLCSHHCRLHPRRNLPPCDKDTGKCLEGCVRGRHGDHCDQLCSQNCINTTCNQPNGGCTLGCTDGYTGYFCNMTTVSTVQSGTRCDSGQYGPNCDLHCSEHCGLLPETNHRPCDKDTGKCLEGCVRGRHGGHCDQPCSQNCINTSCNQPNGGCTLGCTDGYTGYFCNMATGEGHIPQSVNVMSVLPAIIFLLFTTICCWRSGRCRRTCNRWCDWLTERILWPNSTDPSQGRGETDHLLPVAKPTSSTHATPSQADHDLYYASRSGDLEQVRRILSAGHADINSRGWWSRTPVMVAAREGHGDVVELLVSRGADVSLVDYGGNNTLHLACVGGDRKTVEFVLALGGVDVNARNNGGHTAAGVARGRRHPQLSDLLVSRGGH
ncbi:scavenger receptor class F member 2-like isoform X3 [Haliotis rubra]|uniref:scavenger receptor class F member 2-like isoform X3 n=1 Tax=Haliotis rubra TaxID=36100 RepID=UPI001EE5C9AD|nr:scavenger receptor class F member 2-like isoform X3 [Haliotis rubra]